MKAILPGLLFLSISVSTISTAEAQYYYRDIMGTRESNDLIRTYLTNKVKKVVLVSYDADGTRSDGLKVSQEFFPVQRRLLTITGGAGDENYLSTYFNENALVVRTVDSTVTLVTTSTYSYNSDKQLTALYTRSSDSSKNFVQTEEHQWEYQGGKPVKMTKIKNGKLTETVQFKNDDRGNVIEEQSFVNGKPSEAVHYFYDSQGRMTDIVRFNPKARKLLPEYLFEYSSSNQVIQKITVPSNSSNYLIWRYQYDNKGLKIREAIFDKQKQLNGKIEYQYTFGE